MAMLIDRRPASTETDDLEGNRAKAAKKQRDLSKPGRYTAESPQGTGWLDREIAAMRSSNRINPKAANEDPENLESARKRAIEERTPRYLKSGR